ncbi:MAG: tetratricopeptide repeat protein, partial [Chitinophagaceae bacterium]
MAIVYANQGDYHQALTYFQRALKINEELFQEDGLDESKGRIARVLNNIGNIYGTQGNYAQALNHFLRSLSINEELGNKRSIGLTLSNIGLIYNSQGDNLKALEYYQRSMKIYEGLEEDRLVALVLTNISNINLENGENQEALQNFRRTLKIYEEIGDKSGIARSFEGIGVTYENKGDFTQAMNYYQRSLNMYEQIGARGNVAFVQTLIGDFYNIQKNYNIALEWCEKSLKIADEIGDIDIQVSANVCLYNAYKSLGVFDKALEFYEQMIILRDSIKNEDNTRELTQLSMQYEFDKREAATIAEQEKRDAIALQELQRQKLVRNGFMGGFAVVLLFAGIVFTQRNRISREKARSEELLLNILPEETAQELKLKGHSDAQLIDHVTVLFTDFKGFTAMSEKVSPKELVKDLHLCFSAFDEVMEKYGIEKIKTIGDAYMAAGGLPTPNTTHAKDVAKAALEMAQIVEKGKVKKLTEGLPFFEVRIGIHTGPVVAGIVGIKKFQYDIWGDTVNVASRMESSGEVGKV